MPLVMRFNIIHPITGNLFLVDFKFCNKKMSWHDAKKSCKELGIGWRLPRKNHNKNYLLELCEFEIIEELILQKKYIEFSECGFWCESSVNNKKAWLFKFNSNVAWEIAIKSNMHFAIAVKELM